jgi:peroxiredoxin
MSVIAELASDAKFMISMRRGLMKRQIELDQAAPKAGDLAPDFTLYDISGEQSVTLSDFRGEKPVVLLFGSYT